jgi:hypothetical protein
MPEDPFYKSDLPEDFGKMTKRLGPKTIKQGSIIAFKYDFFKNDPYPTIIVTKITPQYICGLNIHVLTFYNIKTLLSKNKINACENPAFNYNLVKGNGYIIKAFRKYKKAGMRSVKIFDCDSFMTLIGIPRIVNPKEAKIIRTNISNQINKKTNINADQITNL